MDLIALGLFLTLASALIGPIISRRVERNLEVYFLALGITASLISGKLLEGGLNWALIEEALLTPVMLHPPVPIGIFQVVLVIGLIFYKFRERICRGLLTIVSHIGVAPFIALMTAIFGLASSFISVIVSSVIVSELIFHMPIERRSKVIATIIACYALGLGAALTPIGEPLSTIAIAKLKGHFFLLFELLGMYVIPMVIGLAVLNYLLLHGVSTRPGVIEVITRKESVWHVIKTALRVYAFVTALVLLGSSMECLIERYFSGLSIGQIYLLGALSAIVDNAALTAAFIGPELTISQVKAFLLSLLISGGFLIPGNVPNIIAAEFIGISFREWARYAIPIGLPLYVIGYIFLSIFL